MFNSELCCWESRPRQLLGSTEHSAFPCVRGVRGEEGDGCLHLPVFSIFLAWWNEGLGGQRRGAELCSGGWKHGTRRGNELPRLLTGGGGGVLLAWLLPISFTSGWAAAPALPLESLARHRGLGWKSPSGWESHKCVNKRDEQSSLLCPGNPGLSWMAGVGLAGCE